MTEPDDSLIVSMPLPGDRRMELTFACHDRSIAHFYSDAFAQQFLAESLSLIAQGPDSMDDAERDAMIEKWSATMAIEAERQEHYDYTTDEDGNRTLRITDEGDRVLLYPDLTLAVVQGEQPQ